MAVSYRVTYVPDGITIVGDSVTYLVSNSNNDEAVFFVLPKYLQKNWVCADGYNVPLKYIINDVVATGGATTSTNKHITYTVAASEMKNQPANNAGMRTYSMRSTSGTTLSKGLYKFNSVITSSVQLGDYDYDSYMDYYSWNSYEELFFDCLDYPENEGIGYYGIIWENNKLLFIDSYTQITRPIYDNGTWITGESRGLYVDIPYDQEVPSYLVNFFLSNTTRIEDQEISGKRVFNDTLNLLVYFSQEIAFTTGSGRSYDLFETSSEDVYYRWWVEEDGYYYTDTVYEESTGGWTNYTDRFIDFGDTPQMVSGLLYAWIMENSRSTENLSPPYIEIEGNNLIINPVSGAVNYDIYIKDTTKYPYNTYIYEVDSVEYVNLRSFDIGDNGTFSVRVTSKNEYDTSYISDPITYMIKLNAPVCSINNEDLTITIADPKATSTDLYMNDSIQGTYKTSTTINLAQLNLDAGEYRFYARSTASSFEDSNNSNVVVYTSTTLIVYMNLSEGVVVLDIENKLCENNIKIIPVKQ